MNEGGRSLWHAAFYELNGVNTPLLVLHHDGYSILTRGNPALEQMLMQGSRML